VCSASKCFYRVHIHSLCHGVLRVSPLLRSCSVGTSKGRADQRRSRQQACLAARSARLAHLLCGSGLARDASGAVFELNRADAIASEPAPTRGCAVSSLNLCFCCSQGDVQTTRMPLFQLGFCGGYVLGGSVVFAAIEQLNSVHIRSMRHGFLRVPPLRRLTFVKQPQK
jgi:hypothetical protein